MTRERSGKIAPLDYREAYVWDVASVLSGEHEVEGLVGRWIELSQCCLLTMKMVNEMRIASQYSCLVVRWVCQRFDLVEQPVMSKMILYLLRVKSL